MTEHRLEYVGPLSTADAPKGAQPVWKKLPWPFLVVVALPTLIAAIYFLFIASPLYVSESRFIVRSAAGGGAPSAFGVALQGIGISAGQTDAFAVHEYITSADSVRDLSAQLDLPSMLGPKGADIFSRYPNPLESRSTEGLEKALERFVTVGYDSTKGISTLRVEAFRPQDAQRLSIALLDGGEKLINRLNERSVNDAVADARLSQERARQRVTETQQQLTAFRNREKFIDPAKSAAAGSDLIGNLMKTVSELEAERSQLIAEAPASPQLPGLNSRIAAYERQIGIERAKIAGDNSSLAPRIGTYEELTLTRDLATEELTQATSALVSAEAGARRQQLYLERVVSPSLPEEAVQPHRWMSILIVLATTLLIYGIGWMIWAGVREHRQG